MMWFYGSFVGYLLDWIFVETFIMAAAPSPDPKTGGVKEGCKKRGTYFDYPTYEKFYYKKIK